MAEETQENKPAPATFEAAFLELRHLSKLMESGEMPLEELEGNYRRAMELSEFCQKKLDAVGSRLKVLARKGDRFEIKDSDIERRE